MCGQADDPSQHDVPREAECGSSYDHEPHLVGYGASRQWCHGVPAGEGEEPT